MQNQQSSIVVLNSQSTLEIDSPIEIARPDYISLKHWEEWLASSVKPFIIAANVRSIHDAREVDRVLSRNTKSKWKHSHNLVPCWEVTGLDPLGWERTLEGVQIKPDIEHRDEGGKIQKYLGASGYDCAPLFLETETPNFWQAVLNDKTQPIILTEGAKKAGAGLSAGYPTISIPGVTTCRKNGRLHRWLEVFGGFGRTFYLVFDNDVLSKKPVQKALLAMARDLCATGSKVMVVMLPEGELKGMDDFITGNGKDEFDKLLENSLTIEEWRKFLEVQFQRQAYSRSDEFNQPQNSQQQQFGSLSDMSVQLTDELSDRLLDKDYNTAMLHLARLRAIHKVYGERLRWNEMRLCVEIDGIEIDVELIEHRLVIDCLLKPPSAQAKLLTYVLAKHNSYHPVRDYLETVATSYSDTAILDDLASKLFCTTEPLYNTMLKKWLVSAVARVFEPGCKADDVLVLHGAQGARKSGFFEVLGGDWFSDSAEGTGNDKDSLMQLHSAWINELAEFDRFLSKRDASDLKKSLSVRQDRFRVPYGRSIETFPRQFVLCGTTNQDEFLYDPTGNRRYWVISVATNEIDLNWLKANRDLIWAAAVHLYRSGYNWYLEGDERKRHEQLNRPFELTDTWETLISDYVHPLTQVTVAQIMSDCLRIDVGQHKRSDQMRVATILKRLGWSKKEIRLGNRTTKGWIKNEVAIVSNTVATEVATAETLLQTGIYKNVATLPTISNNISENSAFQESNGLLSQEEMGRSISIPENNGLSVNGRNVATAEELIAQMNTPVTFQPVATDGETSVASSEKLLESVATSIETSVASKEKLPQSVATSQKPPKNEKDTPHVTQATEPNQQMEASALNTTHSFKEWDKAVYIGSEYPEYLGDVVVVRQVLGATTVMVGIVGRQKTFTCQMNELELQS